MAFLDMFDKLDDIIYKPIETISEWAKEPLRKFEHKRDLESEKSEAEIQAYKNRQAVELSIDERRWNAEIDELIYENQAKHNEELIDALKRYQIDLSNATREIVENLGHMSIELRREANELLEEKTLKYKKIQDEAKQQSNEELKEAKDRFFNDDPETYRLMVTTILSERKEMVEIANQFMLELSNDFKRLNENTDELLKMGMNNVNKYLEPMTKQISSSSNLNANYLEKNDNTIDI